MNLKNYTNNFSSRIKLLELITANFGPYYKEVAEEGVKHLQVKNFSGDGQFLDNVDFYIATEKVDEKHLLKEGDVLFVSKGFKYFAYRYSSKIGPAVASSIFYVLKVTDQERLNAEYLECILNQPGTIKYFENASAGSSIPSIRKNELLDFEIPLPTMELQKKIVEISKVHKKEMELLNQLIEKKKVLFNQSIINLTK